MSNKALDRKQILKMVKTNQITPEEGYRLIQELQENQELQEPNSGEVSAQQVAGTTQPAAPTPKPAATTPLKTTPAGPESTGAAPAIPSTEIAIIGMAGRFPEAANVAEFWRNLAGGVDSIREIPKTRFDIDQYYDPDPKTPNKTYCKWSGLVPDADRFDPLFFNISPREAELMDPQQRVFLEEAWRALEDTGYAPESFADQKCGVFVGVAQGDYVENLKGPGNDLEVQLITGTYSSFLAARISYFLNLTGPSIAIDTACSSSLVAIHQACQSIISGESEIALAGGIYIFATPGMLIMTSKGGMLSKTGRCKAFDNDADGFVPTEGVGVVVLKPLARALADRDQIYGVIKGTGINQDGKTNGITAPSGKSQTRLELEVYQNFGLDAAAISYLEAHGTGTKLGDPIEVTALTKAFREYTDQKQYCAIGSVKTNIGHGITSAGVAGLIKILLCLKHRKLVPSLHFKNANEHINFKDSPFYVCTELSDWTTRNQQPRLAALSSFGLSGTNCHMVIGEAPPPAREADPASAPYYLIPLSAKTREALLRKQVELADWLEDEAGDCSIADLAYTLQTGRSHFPVRCAVVAADLADLKAKLQIIREQGSAPDYFENTSDAPVKLESQLTEDGRRWLSQLQAGAVPEPEAYQAKLLAVAKLYVQGANLDWAVNYPVAGRRISLPTYPFARERYWIAAPAPTAAVNGGVAANEKLHPLVARNCSTLFEQKYQNTLTGAEFFLTDHIVAGRKMLPGVTYLEAIYAIGKLAATPQIGKIKDLYWLHPVVVEGTPVELEIVIVPNSDWLGFEFQTRAEAGGHIVHCRGKISYQDLDPGSVDSTYLQLDELMQGCLTRQSGAECYARHAHLGVRYGPGFKSVQYIMNNEREVVARLELPETLESDFDRYYLHPSLLDGALQTVIGLGDWQAAEPDATYLPFSVAEVEINHPLPRVCYVYANRSAVSQLPESKVREFDITVTDERGLVLVKLKRYAVRPFRGDVSGDAPARAETVYFANQWERWDDAAMAQAAAPLTVLVFDTEEALSGRLRQAAAVAAVYLVKPGADFAQLDPATYQINPARLEDYQRLAESLKAAEVKLTGLVYRWADQAELSPETNLERVLEYGPAALLYLTQAFMKYKVTDRLTLLYSYLYQNEIEPCHEAINGFAKTVRLENPNFTYKTVGFEQPGATPVDWEPLIEPLMRELTAGYDSGTEIRYSNGVRWVKRLRTIAAAPAKARQLPLKDQGVYLISGGAGGLGLIFAEYLAGQVQARIILTGRSELGAARAAKLEAIKARGSEVIYIKTDIADREQVESLIAEVKSQFGRIDGVIHSAGVLQDSFILKKTKAALAAVVAPKIGGALLLDEATRDERLDFFVLFSSMAGVIGNLGQADYSYANAFLDSWAAARETRRNNGQRWGRTVAINWPLWQDGGMTVDPQSQIWLKQKVGMVALDREAGIAAFEHCLLSEAYPQIAVLKGDPDQIQQVLAPGWLKEASPGPEAPTPVAGGPAADPELREAAEACLKQVFSKVLKLDPARISSTNSFESYGIDSVMIVSLNLELENVFGELPKTLLFEYQNLAELIEYFIAQHRSKLAAPTGRATLETTPAAPVPAEQERRTLSLETSRFYSQLPRHGAARPDPETDLAIIGVSGQYPMADNLEQFWENLKSGRDCIEEIPAQRWDYREYYDPDKEKKGKSYSKWGGFLSAVDQFDPLFFNITPKDAENMDPQARLFLKTVWQLVEDAGYTRESLSDATVGVFVGVMYSLYQLYGVEEAAKGNPLALDSSFASIANRVSYFFNFKGPSIALDTMCSSSLTSVHWACESIRRGECDLAVAGGVNLSLHPNKYLMLSQGKFTSTDGRCRSFGAGGDGYVPGEGVGAILIKPLSRAVRDRDHIYAVIKGSWINHGGKTNGYTVPNPRAQAALIAKALQKSRINPRSISYLEAHGTGTALGDPIEITGLEESFREYTDAKQFCAIGSVKSNIGHLESAAGVAGITKVLLQLKYRQLVPSLHSEQLNQNINFANTPFYVQRELTRWQQPQVTEDGVTQTYPRRAGISAFGAGGANAHLILEEFPAVPQPAELSTGPQVVVLSAKSQAQLREYARKMAAFIDRNIIGPVLEEQLDRLDPQLEKDLCRIVARILNVRESDLRIEDGWDELNFTPAHFSELAGALGEQYRIAVELADLGGCTSLQRLLQYLKTNYREALARYYPTWTAAAPEYQEVIGLRDFAYTLQVGREAFDERLAIVAADWPTVREGLDRYLQGAVAAAVYTGNVKQAPEAAVLAAANAGPDMTQALIQRGELDQLARLWVAGVRVDWRELHDSLPQRVALPTYPFADKRYWFNSYQEKTAAPADFAAALPGTSYHPGAAARVERTKTPAVKEYHGTEVVWELIDDSIAVITMQDQKHRNMFSDQIIAGLIARFAEVEKYPGIKAVVLTGSNNIFSMGGTQEQLNNIADRKSSFTDAPFLYRGLLETTIPVISAIQGHASGGGLLFGLYADIVVMAEESVYSAVFTKYGFTPGMGATFILKEKFGNNLATEMMFTAKAFRGEELKERGASVIFKKRREVLNEAVKIARMLAQKPLHTLQVLKRELADRILAQLPTYIERETYMHGLTFSHPEVKERIQYYFGHAQAEQPAAQAADLAVSTSVGRGATVTDGHARWPNSEAHSERMSEAAVQQAIGAILENVLRIPAAEIDRDLSFREMGIDSINGVELIRDINKQFHLNLDAVIIYDYSTISQLAHKIVQESVNAPAPAVRESAAPAASPEKPARPGWSDPAAAPTWEEIAARISAIVSGNLHIDEAELSQELSFRELGVDSINSVEIIRDINQIYGLNLDAVIIYDYSTIPALAKEVEQQVRQSSQTNWEQISNNAKIREPEVRPAGPATPPEQTIPAAGNAGQPGIAAVEAAIIKIVNDNLHLDTAELHPDLNFKDLGVDSINGVEIVRDINRQFGVNLDAIIIYDYPTVGRLARHVVDEQQKSSSYREISVTEGLVKEQPKAPGAARHRERFIVSGPVPAQPLRQPVSQSPERPVVSGSQVKKPLVQSEGIAIIGISGRFPGADNVSAFWNNLQRGVDSVGEVPAERWEMSRYFDPNPQAPNKTYCRYGGFLNHTDKFDSLFFNISPLEAELMDPQQRIFLEESWKALEDAGYSDQALSNLRCGVFVGATHGDYVKKLSPHELDYTGEAFTGLSAAILASRISYFLNLTGPSIALDTACSSSLVAIHQACQSILNHESDLALAGGIRLMFTPDFLIQNSKLGVLSPSGKCRAFDQAADGIVISEGVGVVVLKPLAQALRDRDHIYGVIVGSGLNQDGKTNGITAPSAQSQTRLELEVYRRYNINPATISYVEAHGTGTRLGDPIEIKALKEAFAEFTTKKQFCPIGSVKTNIGHTTMAAGVASLIKVVLALQNRKIPPSLHYQTANEHIDFPDSPFYVNTQLTDWVTPKGLPRRAAISAFGFSGTNCHLVVEEAPSE